MCLKDVEQFLGAVLSPLGKDTAVLDFGNEERRWLHGIRNGDRRVAEEMVERTYNAVYASLYRLCGGNADLAADLTQDSYRKAWEAIAAFDGRAKFSTWLYRIAYTTFLNHVRRPDRVVPMKDPAMMPLPDPRPGAEESLSKTEDEQQLREAVLGLPDDLRFTVTAHFWSDLSVTEIARVEGVTSVAIRKRLKKAFGLLEMSLDKDVA